jgi:5'(3')-deoxyribonucleotidase
MMDKDFILGLDLDGVCADFYRKMRTVAAEWLGKNIDDLPADVTYGFPEWGLKDGEYDRIHRFAVTQRDLFSDVDHISGAPQSIRRLGTEGVRIRIITHRLFIRHFHETAVQQTVRWLDNHAIPYWDLCFMRDKTAVDADLYVEDSPSNIERLLETAPGRVVVFTNSTNSKMFDGIPRANTWQEAEELIRRRYYEWLHEVGKDLPAGPGESPSWLLGDGRLP